MKNTQKTTSFKTIAVLGTGLIGAPIARNLQAASFNVRAWNRTTSKAEPLKASGVTVCATATEAVKDSDIIITLLKDGPSALETMKAALPELRKGKVWLQMSTVGVGAIKELESFAKQQGLIFYDTPVQGTRQPAEQGQLVILASGPVNLRDSLQPVFDAISKKIYWLSDEIGTSSRLKLALNNWVLALTHGVAESLALAKGLGLDPALVVEVVTGGPMDSGYFQAKAAAILADNYDTSFSVINAIKDAELVITAAAESNIQLDSVPAGLQRLRRALENGHGNEDFIASYLA